MAVQGTYKVQPDRGRPGVLARPSQPWYIDTMLSYVPASGTAPEPGWGVYYDAANNGFAVPTNSDQQKDVVGIVASPGNVVQETDGDVEFKNGAQIEVFTGGTIWVTAEAALEYGDLVVFDHGSKKWEKWNIPSPGTSASSHTNWFNALQKIRFTVVSQNPVKADEIVQVRIGAGRIT